MDQTNRGTTERRVIGGVDTVLVRMRPDTRDDVARPTAEGKTPGPGQSVQHLRSRAMGSARPGPLNEPVVRNAIESAVIQQSMFEPGLAYDTRAARCAGSGSSNLALGTYRSVISANPGRSGVMRSSGRSDRLRNLTSERGPRVSTVD